MRYVKGYRIIDIPLGNTISGHHSIYIKEHQPNTRSSGDGAAADTTATSDGSGKILFIGNVDYRINMSHEQIDGYLRLLFERFGDIRSITVSEFAVDQSANTRFAHLTFAKKSTLRFALETGDAEYAPAVEEVAAQFGFEAHFEPKSKQQIREMMGFYRGSRDPRQLQQEVDEFMLQFEEKESAALRKREEALNTADEDGFMPVKIRSKRKRLADGAVDAEAAEGKRGAGAPRARKKKKSADKELKNFYRFQIRQDKMQELHRLRQKFQEDREKVAKLKETRKFRPF